jgi:hypothetical protein
VLPPRLYPWELADRNYPPLGSTAAVGVDVAGRAAEVCRLELQ